MSDYFNALDARRVGFEGRAQMGGFGASVLLRLYPRGLLHHHNQRISRNAATHDTAASDPAWQ